MLQYMYALVAGYSDDICIGEGAIPGFARAVGRWEGLCMEHSRHDNPFI